jgi:hypothetical protein
VKKAIIFIVGATIATHQMTNCVTQLQAAKMGYKHVIYESAEAKYYLEKATAVPSKQIYKLPDFKTAYEESLSNIDLVPYYQNQYFRSELYNLAQSTRTSPQVIKPMIKPLLNQIDERIDSLVEKYAEKIMAFENVNNYADKPDEGMKQLARSGELNEWSKDIRKSEPQEDVDHDKNISTVKKRVKTRSDDWRPIIEPLPGSDNTPK